MSERKVLMMSPYWPPTNRIGLWRALRLARYLPEFNWTPVICTPRQEDIFHFSLLAKGYTSGVRIGISILFQKHIVTLFFCTCFLSPGGVGK